MSSSGEAVTRAVSGLDAPAWPVPGGDGVRLPWLALVIGRDGPLEALPARDVEARPDGSFALASEGRSFAATCRWGVPDETGGTDVELRLTCRAPEALDASIGVSLLLDATATPWVLVPGLVYGENRPAGSTIAYPRFEPGAWDPERFVADRWAFRIDRAAVPLVIASDGRRSAGLATEPSSELGLPGVAFAADAGSTGIGLFFPYHEQPVSYDGGPRPRPGGPTFHRWQPGETHGIRLRAYAGPPDRTAFVPWIEDLRARLAPDEPLRPGTDVADLSTTAALAAEGLLRWHWRPADRALLETAAFERGPGPAAPGEAPGDRSAMHVAWLSGTPPAHALLLHGRRVGDDAAVATGAAVIDAVSEHLAPAGTFWGQWTAERGWGTGWTPGDDALHARTLAEATLFVVRAVAAEAGHGRERAAWRVAARSNLGFAASVQRDDGAFGSVYDGSTGAVRSWAGTAGLAWVPALVEGARLLHEPSWVAAAERGGRWYARAVEAAFLHGAPEDVDLAPTSEDGYVAVMAYVALAESAGAAGDETARREWLRLARLAAAWMLTFRYAYDVGFERATLLGRAGYRTRGLDQASVVNQHLHVYGLVCTPELVRLSRASGDGSYAEAAREHLLAARQTLVRVDGEWNGLRGMAFERAYQTACFGPKGGIGALSHAWCLGLLLYAAEVALGLPELREADDG